MLWLRVATDVVSSRNRVVSSCHALVASRNGVVSSRNLEVSTCHALVASRNRVVSSRNAVIASRNVVVASRNLSLSCTRDDAEKTVQIVHINSDPD